MQNKIIEDGHTTIAKQNSRLAEIKTTTSERKSIDKYSVKKQLKNQH
jgi:hypothetical protein